MYMELENIEVFLKLLEAEEEKTTTPIFIKEVKALGQDGKLYAEILIQAEYNIGMLVQYRISEGIDPVPQYSDAFISSLSDAKKQEFQEIMKNGISHQDAQIETEKSKVVEILKATGYQIFIPGVWEA